MAGGNTPRSGAISKQIHPKIRYESGVPVYDVAEEPEAQGRVVEQVSAGGVQVGKSNPPGTRLTTRSSRRGQRLTKAANIAEYGDGTTEGDWKSKGLKSAK